MVKREIFNALENHLEKKWITVIMGMRRVGKTTALKYLLGKVKTNNKIYFDLERVEHRYLFKQDNYTDIELSFQVFKRYYQCIYRIRYKTPLRLFSH